MKYGTSFNSALRRYTWKQIADTNYTEAESVTLAVQVIHKQFLRNTKERHHTEYEVEDICVKKSQIPAFFLLGEPHPRG